MKYDFETLVSRKNVGSSKWNLMDKMNPKVNYSIKQHICTESIKLCYNEDKQRSGFEVWIQLIY